MLCVLGDVPELELRSIVLTLGVERGVLTVLTEVVVAVDVFLVVSHRQSPQYDVESASVFVELPDNLDVLGHAPSGEHCLGIVVASELGERLRNLVRNPLSLAMSGGYVKGV